MITQLCNTSENFRPLVYVRESGRSGGWGRSFAARVSEANKKEAGFTDVRCISR